MRGRNQMRSRNVNAPDASGVRPEPASARSRRSSPPAGSATDRLTVNAELPRAAAAHLHERQLHAGQREEPRRQRHCRCRPTASTPTRSGGRRRRTSGTGSTRWSTCRSAVRHPRQRQRQRAVGGALHHHHRARRQPRRREQRSAGRRRPQQRARRAALRREHAPQRAIRLRRARGDGGGRGGGVRPAAVRRRRAPAAAHGAAAQWRRPAGGGPGGRRRPRRSWRRRPRAAAAAAGGGPAATNSASASSSTSALQPAQPHELRELQRQPAVALLRQPHVGRRRRGGSRSGMQLPLLAAHRPAVSSQGPRPSGSSHHLRLPTAHNRPRERHGRRRRHHRLRRRLRARAARRRVRIVDPRGAGPGRHARVGRHPRAVHRGTFRRAAAARRPQPRVCTTSFIARVGADAGIDIEYRALRHAAGGAARRRGAAARGAGACLDAARRGAHACSTGTQCATLEPGWRRHVARRCSIPSTATSAPHRSCRRCVAAARAWRHCRTMRCTYRSAPRAGCGPHLDGASMRDAVVIAAGSWSARHADVVAAAARPPVRPIRGQLVQLDVRSRRCSHVVWGPACYSCRWRDGSRAGGRHGRRTSGSTSVRPLAACSGCSKRGQRAACPRRGRRRLRRGARRPAARHRRRVADRSAASSTMPRRVLRHRALPQRRAAGAADGARSIADLCSTAASARASRLCARIGSGCEAQEASTRRARSRR